MSNPLENRICEHDKLRRQCNECDLMDEITELREAVRVLAEGYTHWTRWTNCPETPEPGPVIHNDIRTNPIAAEALRAAEQKARTDD